VNPLALKTKKKKKNKKEEEKWKEKLIKPQS
jgi:hypothetical protein